MRNLKINYILEFLCPTLVISYFYFHNIIFVLIGIIFSLYLINIEFISGCWRSVNNRQVYKKLSSDLKKNYNLEKSDLINIHSTKLDSDLALVETVEDLGFIPSLDKNNDNTTA